MTIKAVKLKRFTAFKSLDFRPSPGVNVLVGANGTGKTHLMKVAYAACAVSKTRIGFAEKLARVFMPTDDNIGRLVNRDEANTNCEICVSRPEQQLYTSFTNLTAKASSAQDKDASRWTESPVESVYIPVKEMLANAPGFRSLYSQRNIHFEEIYADILDRVYQPGMRGDVPPEHKKLLGTLQTAIEGKVTAQNEEFFLQSSRGSLEFSLVAEGMRKLGLLWLLIRNGTLLEGSVLFWDEPETNLNPKLFELIISILLELQRMGVQIFLATHDYIILKELDLQKKKNDEIVFHAFYRDDGAINCNRSEDYINIHPNSIAETFDSLYDREVRRSLLLRGKSPSSSGETSG